MPRVHRLRVEGGMFRLTRLICGVLHPADRSASWRVSAQRAELGNEPFDLRGIDGPRIFGGENPQTNLVLAARAMEKSVLVNPADAFVGKEIDSEHLERVAGAAPGIVQRRLGKLGRPALCQGGFVWKTDAAGEHTAQPRASAEPLAEELLHWPRVNSMFPRGCGCCARTA